MDFVEGQEPVTVSAVLDERRLQAGFDPGYLGEIDVSAKLLFRLAFEIKFFNPVSVHHDDTGLFRVRRVDQHSLCHQIGPWGARPASRRGASFERSRAQAGLGAAKATR